MPWVPLDDNFHSHRKVVTAGNEAIGLHCRALSWVGANLTDGYVPAPVAHALAGARRGRLVRVLVDVDLWEVADGGWRIHGWTERNPPSDVVRARRDAVSDERRRAGRAGAAKRWGRAESKHSPAQSKHSPAQSDNRPDDPSEPDSPMAKAVANGMAKRWPHSQSQSLVTKSCPVPSGDARARAADGTAAQDQDQEIPGQDVFGAVRAARERAGRSSTWWTDSAQKVALKVASNSHPNLQLRDLELALVTIASWPDTRSPSRLVHVVEAALREAHSNGQQPSSLPPLPPTVDQLRARGDLGNQP